MSASLLLEHTLYLTITIMTKMFMTALLIYSDHALENDQSYDDLITMN